MWLNSGTESRQTSGKPATQGLAALHFAAVSCWSSWTCAKHCLLDQSPHYHANLLVPVADLASSTPIIRYLSVGAGPGVDEITSLPGALRSILRSSAEIIARASPRQVRPS